MAYYFVEIYKHTNSESNDMHCLMKKNKCNPKWFLDFIKPYAMPAEMEYFLLLMIFIAELCPSNDNEPQYKSHEQHLANVNTPLLNCSTSLSPVTDLVKSHRKPRKKAKQNTIRILLRLLFSEL